MVAALEYFECTGRNRLKEVKSRHYEGGDSKFQTHVAING